MADSIMFLRDQTNNGVKRSIREQHAKVIYEGFKNMATGLDGEPDVVMGAKNGFVAVGDCVLISTEKWRSAMESLCRECDYTDVTITKHVVEAIVKKLVPHEHLANRALAGCEGYSEVTTSSDSGSAPMRRSASWTRSSPTCRSNRARGHRIAEAGARCPVERPGGVRRSRGRARQKFARTPSVAALRRRERHRAYSRRSARWRRRLRDG
jgi:hypothetical protein